MRLLRLKRFVVVLATLVASAVIAGCGGGGNGSSFILAQGANLAPSFGPVPDQTLASSSPPQTLTLTQVTSGSADEDRTQTVTFRLSSRTPLSSPRGRSRSPVQARREPSLIP